jgi:hypothetical protein
MYTVYKITNNINGKYYIGVHKTNDPNDNYYGSGTTIKKAIKKYGKENFSKEILYTFECKRDAYLMESKIVDINDPKSYNEKEGGIGGWDYVNLLNLPNPMHNEETKNKVISKLKGRKKIGKEYESTITNAKLGSEARKGIKDSPEVCKRKSESLKKYYECNESFHKNKAKTKEHKEAMSLGWTQEKRNKKSQQQKERILKNPDVIKTNLGKTFTDEHKHKQSVAAKKLWEERKKLFTTCPHCGKIGIQHSMKKWHFNNCKNKV